MTRKATIPTESPGPVKINARLHAKDLSVTVGENRTDARGNVIATASTSGKTERFFD
ncbi:Uncharacterised protein [Kluyvera cryocrescens]|uniref:Uncharacterized protein n=1 Tax=Kluyvera cryocrescens TaxID=580 RepID=A0A485CSN4_KLUCR|nr:Uncharacterised protein [Kluyvera cryocrescens]